MATTMREAHSTDAAYWGERGDWIIIASKHRDSDALTRANFDAAIALAESRGVDCERETSGHWLVGHIEYAIVPPTEAGRALDADIAAQLSDYPVLDDERFSEYEYAEILETLADFADFELRHTRGLDVDPQALAPHLYDALTEGNGDGTPYLDRWPDLDRGQSPAYDERSAVASALRAYRRETRTAAA